MDRGAEAAHKGFIGVLLSLQKQGATSILITNDTIALLMFVSRPTLICSADLFATDSDTSASILKWIMIELVQHPAVMSKAQAKVREAFKGKSGITKDDIAQADPGFLQGDAVNNFFKKNSKYNIDINIYSLYMCATKIELYNT
jgi:hypothetical protein